MNVNTIGIIIRREYLNRVKKKSFIILTFVAPILFAALCILPSVIMMTGKEESKKLAVIDQSGIVMPLLEDSEAVDYTDCSTASIDSVKSNLAALGYDGVLVVSALDVEARTVSADIYSPIPLGMNLTESIGYKLDQAVEDYRISQYNIEGLEEIMKDVKADVRLKSYTLGDDGEEKISESGVYMAVSMILGMIIYLFVIMFGSMVMSSVIEEKSSRVVEVLISSVKATELMFGKIIGIALVALTQFMLWIVLTFAIVGVAGAVAGPALLGDTNPEEVAQMTQMMTAGDPTTAQIADMASEPGAMSVIVSSLSNMPIGQIVVSFFLYFIFGYMLYASLFAAIGSAVENEGDSNQLQMPLTVPILLGFFIAISAFNNPNSQLVFWGSMIPFTSPIVMLARLPFGGVPMWELVLSLVLLVATFALCAWVSAKIYRVGILMFGKKSTWKDLWKWLKQK